MVSIGNWARLLAGVRLGRLRQYPARPVCLPAPDRDMDPDGAQLPSIALVTPSLNQHQYIGQAIRSVLDQAYGRLQYVVQDGGSTDGSERIAQRLAAGVCRVVVEADRGQADAINRGFERTDSEIMGWLNSDDLLAPGTLHRVGRYFHDHPSVDMIYGNRLIVDESGLEVGRWILPDHDTRLLSFVDYVPQESMFWRRRLWVRAGARLDVELQFVLDWDLILRFLRVGAIVRHVPDLYGIFRIHPAQKTQSRLDETGRAEMRRVRADYGGLRIAPWSRAWIHARYLWRHKAADRRYEAAFD